MNTSIYGTSESIIEAQLREGEQILWTGQPRKGVMLQASDAFLIPFTLLWGGFAFFWEITVVASGAPVFFMLWGIPFCLAGIYLIFGRFFVDARRRDQTHYAVTNDRVLIVTGNGLQVKSLSLHNLPDISVDEKADGSGTITFGSSPWGSVGALYRGMPTGMVKSNYLPPAFDMIADVRRVYDIILDAQSRIR